MPSVSKKQFSTHTKRKTLNLNEENQLIGFAKKEPHLWVQKHGEIHGIGKTSVASMLKNKENILKEF